MNKSLPKWMNTTLSGLPLKDSNSLSNVVQQALKEFEQILLADYTIRTGRRARTRLYQFFCCAIKHLNNFTTSESFKAKMLDFGLPGKYFQRPIIDILFFKVFSSYMEYNSYSFIFSKRHEEVLNKLIFRYQNSSRCYAYDDTIKELFFDDSPTYALDVAVDRFLVNSIILKLWNQPENDIQRFQMYHLSTHLCSQYDSILERARRLDYPLSTSKGALMEGWNPFPTAIRLLNISNTRIRDEMSLESFAPLILEFVGMSGIGKTKSTFQIGSVLHPLFPYLDKTMMVYTRPNDKFFNGYKQHPVMLYDDPNHSRLAYDLGTELIFLGSGSLQYPPMAFDKETRFGSIVVVVTTNKPLSKTLSKACRGAVNRRVTSLKVTTVGNSGAVKDGYFQYHPSVVYTPFHLRYNKDNLFEIIAQSLHHLSKMFANTLPECSCCYITHSSKDEKSNTATLSSGRASSVDGSIPPLNEETCRFETVSEAVSSPLAHPNRSLMGGGNLTFVRNSFSLSGSEEPEGEFPTPPRLLGLDDFH